MFELVILVHVIGACVWTGGHLVLLFAILPTVLKQRDLAYLQRFESGFEKIGIPALAIQIVSGIYLASVTIGDLSQMLAWENPAARLVFVKLSLLLITAILAADARLRILPKLHAGNLHVLILHIIPVTILSVLFVASGVLYRFGWFS